MKFRKVLLLLFTFFLLSLTPQARERGRMMASRGRFAGLSTIGQNLGQGLLSLYEGDNQQEYPKKSKDKLKKAKHLQYTQRRRQLIQTNWQTIIETAIIVLVITCIILAYFLCGNNKAGMSNQSKQTQRQRILKRHADQNKHFETIKFIAQHGVHPHRVMKTRK